MSESLIRPDLLEKIFCKDYSWLVQRLRFKLTCSHEAEDIASESFLKLATSRQMTALNEPRAILTTISNRLIFEVSRRRSLERAYLEAIASEPTKAHPSPETQHIYLEALLLLDRALEKIPSKARQAFFYSQLDGLTYSAIAERLGVSASMVRQYMTKALTQCYLVSNGAELT